MNENIKSMNANRIRGQLFHAKVDLDKLKDFVASNNLTDNDDVSLALYFQPVLEHLCLAWHCRYMSDDEIDGMSQEVFEELSSKVPNFACMFHMGESGT